MSCRQKIAFSLMSATLFLMPSFSSSAETLITTVDGREYIGEVISAGVNTLKMKLEESGYQIVPVQSIAQIQIDIANSAPIEGKYLDWSDGEIIVRVGDRDVAVRDGTIISVTDVGVAAGGPEKEDVIASTPPPIQQTQEQERESNSDKADLLEILPRFKIEMPSPI